MDKKLVFVVILCVLAVSSLLYGILTPSRMRRGASAPSQTQNVPAAQPQLPVERRAKKSSFIIWGRNPFSLKNTNVSTPVLNGIAWDENAPRAIINDQIVGVGDMIGKNKVVAITPNSVTLNDGTKDFEIRTGQK